MSLIDLKTDLKSLKYGKDRKGGGDSNQPYIKSGIPDGSTSSSPDFLLRNGYLNPGNVANDVSRLTQMFFDLKSPNGILFTAKQNLLSRTAVQTQTSGIINSGVYNPLSTIAQAGVVSIGGHLNKQGDNPFDSTGAYSQNDNLYGVKVKWNQDFKDNRLYEKYNEFILKPNKVQEILSYPGGPNSNLGIGNTNIRFASPEQRTGINNPNGSGIVDNTYQTSRLINRVSLSVNKKPLGASYYYKFKSNNVLFNLDPSLTLDGGYTFELRNVETNVYVSGSLNPTERIKDNGTLVYNQEQIQTTSDDINKQRYVSGFTPTTQDFREILRKNLTTSSIMSNAPSYNVADNKTIEGRNLLGDPGNRAGKNLISYTNGSGIGPVDKINALPIYRSQWVTPEDNLKNDLVKFRIAAIEGGDPNWKNFMHFRAFIDSFSDSYTGDWNPTKYLGRGENFYNYNGFTRTISLSWTVAAQSKEELIPMYKKLNYLASNLMPDYSKKGYMRGPLMQLTMGGYLYEQVGFFTSLTYEIPSESPWEIGINDEGGEDSNVKELPHMIKVQAGFTPIHDFVPSKQDLIFNDSLQDSKGDKYGGFANGYGQQRFIALAVGSGSQYNNYDTSSVYQVGNGKYKVV
jgi:hypothetical protein